MLNLVRPNSAASKALDKFKVDIAAAETELEEIAGAHLAAEDILSSVKTKLEVDVEDNVRVQMQYLMHPGRSELPSPTMGMLYWLFGDDLLDLMQKRFASTGIKLGLPLKERKLAIEKQKKAIKNLLELEEREFLRLETGGCVAVRRLDADPELVLRIWNEQPALK